MPGTNFLTIANVTANASATSLATANVLDHSTNGGTAGLVLQNFNGPGQVVVNNTNFCSVTFDGAVNSGAFVHLGASSGTGGVNVFNPAETANFQMNGGTLELDAGQTFALLDNAQVHTGRLIGNAGKRFGRPRGPVDLRWPVGQGLGLGPDHPVHERPPGQLPSQFQQRHRNLINEFQGPLVVAAGDTGLFITNTSGTLTHQGVIQFDNVQLGSGATMQLGRSQPYYPPVVATNVTVNGTAAMQRLPPAAYGARRPWATSTGRQHPERQFLANAPSTARSNPMSRWP